MSPRHILLTAQDAMWATISAQSVYAGLEVVPLPREAMQPFNQAPEGLTRRHILLVWYDVVYVNIYDMILFFNMI